MKKILCFMMMAVLPVFVAAHVSLQLPDALHPAISNYLPETDHMLAAKGIRQLATLQGVVYDATYGQPLGGVAISVMDSIAYSQYDGSYELTIDEGFYDVYFQKDGWYMHASPGYPLFGTQQVNVSLVRLPLPFPFTETWDSVSFASQYWQFEPSQGNWQINDTLGNPFPCATFLSQPGQTDYSYSMTSHTIDATTSLINVSLSFDMLLQVNDTTGLEKLKVEVWDGQQWVQVVEFANHGFLPWTTYTYDITPMAAGKVTKLKFTAYGVDADAIIGWQLDNIALVEIIPPGISVYPSSMFIWNIFVYPGITIYRNITISNTGGSALIWSGDIQYIYPPVTDEPVDYTGKNGISALYDIEPPDAQVGFRSHELNGNTELYYDGGYSNNGIGTGGIATFICAVRFTPAELTSHYGKYITKVKLHIRDPHFSNITIKVWKEGAFGNPGTEVHSQDATSQIIVNDWTTITLVAPVELIAGKEYWIGYSISTTGDHPCSVDYGPIVAGKGGWVYYDNVWQELTAFGLNYNWCLRAIVGFGNYWLTIHPKEGVIQPGESQNVVLKMVWPDIYTHYCYANILLNNNSLVTQVIVPVEWYIYINRIEVSGVESLRVFPTPAYEILYIESKNGYSSLSLINLNGSIVYEGRNIPPGTHSINVRGYPPGIYLLRISGTNDRELQRKVVISR